MANNTSVGGSTNTSPSTDNKIYLPTKEQVASITSTLGSTGDTGGGDGIGTINAKLNRIINSSNGDSVLVGSSQSATQILFAGGTLNATTTSNTDSKKVANIYVYTLATLISPMFMFNDGQNLSEYNISGITVYTGNNVIDLSSQYKILDNSAYCNGTDSYLYGYTIDKVPSDKFIVIPTGSIIHFNLKTKNMTTKISYLIKLYGKIIKGFEDKLISPYGIIVHSTIGSYGSLAS